MWTIGIGVLVASAVMQVSLVVLLAAARPRGNIYYKVIGVSVASLAALLGLSAIGVGLGAQGLGLEADGLVFFSAAHLSIGALLFHFITLPDRSVTLRVLVELLLAPDGRLRLAELAGRYGVRAMIASRIDQLADGQFLTIGAGGDIELLPRGRLFGRLVVAGRSLFGIESAN